MTVTRDDDYTPAAINRTLDEKPGEELIQAKGVMDGANRLWIAAAMLEEEARALRAMEEDGWELTGPIENDHGYVRQVKRDGQRAERRGPG